MTHHTSTEEIVRQIRQLYKTDSMHAEDRIEAYLNRELAAITNEERIAYAKKLGEKFNSSVTKSDAATNDGEHDFNRLLSMIFGERLTREDLSSTDTLERLAESLNMIFDSLVNLINSINSKLYGKEFKSKAIRTLIIEKLDGEQQVQSLENYLEQIKKAFLLMDEVYKEAAKGIVAEILTILSPTKLDESVKRGIKTGPFRKANLYKHYEHRFKKINNWLESGEFSKTYSSEIEKTANRKLML